jgi:hypothetical protein
MLFLSELQKKLAWQRKVANILRLPMIDKIDFFLTEEFIDVSPRRLREVADAVEQSLINVKVADTGSKVDAAYSPHTDTMTLRSYRVPDTMLGRAAIVHEGTHALVDLFRYTKATELTDEVAAYLSETLFLRAIGLTVKGGGASIYAAAFQIIDAHNLGKGKKVTLKWADYLPLREAIHADTAYNGIADRQLTSGHGVGSGNKGETKGSGSNRGQIGPIKWLQQTGRVRNPFVA